MPTPFRADDEIDMTSRQRTVDFLLATDISGFCMHANWSEQFALTDAERDQITEAF
jgi:dihydrodipicolinate synthase/N-acetylneuraminate lyase